MAFAGPLALYTATLVPGIAFWDTGEMQTVPTILGIAHPTGFPAFVLLGWLFAHGVPFGTPAWRVSLFSACATAAAAWLLFRLVRMLTRDAAVALAAAYAFAAGDIVWTRATRAEVHVVALFFVALALVTAAHAGRNRDARSAYAAAGACGFALATHPVAALALPSVAILGWPALRRFGAPLLGGVTLAAAAPLLLYLYVPLRSAQVERRGLDPATALGLQGGAFWDYDAPSTPARFARYVGGGSFEPAHAFGASLTQGGLSAAVAFARTVATTEYGIVMVVVVVTGFAYLAAREPRVASAFVVLAVAGAAFVPNFHAESDTLRYALPSMWAAGVCAGVGAWWLMRSLTGQRSGFVSMLAALLLAVAIWPNVVYAAHDVGRQRRADDARQFADSIAALTPDDALVIATWTYATPLAYAAYVVHGFGRRRLVSGWPNDFIGRYAAWRGQFGHVYFVLPSRYDVAPLGTRRFGTDRWQLAELRR